MPAFHVSPCVVEDEYEASYCYGPSDENEQGGNTSREEPRPLIGEGCNSHDTHGIDHG